MKWTERDIKTLRRMFAKGASDHTIGDALGRTATSVGSYRSNALYLQRPRTSSGCPATVWVGKRVERLKALWADGLSARQIAMQLGGTRNSIIGALHRNGLMRANQPKPKSNREGVMRPTKGQGDRPKARRLTAAVMARLRPEPPYAGATVTLEHLQPTGCRWVIGHPVRRSCSTLFCDAKKLRGKPYCAAHYALAYSGVTVPKYRPDYSFKPRDNRILEAAE